MSLSYNHFMFDEILKKIEEVCIARQYEDEILNYQNEIEDYFELINKVAIVYIFDTNKKMIYVNDFFIELSKYDKDDILGQDYRSFFHYEMPKPIIEEQSLILENGKKWQGKIKYLTRKNKCIDLSGLHTHLLSLGVIKPSNGGKNKGNNTHTILDNTISDKTRLESINTLAEQSSAYKYLVKTKENIWEFIKTEKPQFIEPYADYWNLFADKYGLAKVQKVTNSRKKKFKTRLAEEKFNFLKITKKLTEASDFVLTQKWMTFDWVIFSESNYVKILEGNYDKTAINNEKAININKTPEPEYTNLDGR